MKNKFLITILLCFCLCGCGNYRELNDMAIVTVVAIDKSSEKYEMSFLIANARNSNTTSKEGEAQTTVYSGKGDSLTEAAEHIDFKSPKELYLGHVNVVIISEEIGKEGFLKIADFLMRYPETRKQFFLMQAKDCKAKDILKMVSPLESFPSQHIASLLKSNRHTESVTDIVDYASFISLNSKPGIDPILPTITIIGDKKKGQKEAVLESTAQKAYVKLDSAAIYKNGKFLDYLSFKDNLMVTMINNKINEMNTVFKYKNGKIGFNSDNIKTKTTVTDNIVQISVSGEGSLFEVNSKAKIDNKKVLNDVENVLNKTIEKRIKKVVNDMQVKYQADVFGFGNKIYQNNPKLWKQIDKNWDNYYFPNLKIKANSNIKITSTGSLNKTILEEKHETDN